DLRGNVKEIGGLKEKRKFFRKENFSLFVIPKEGNEVLRYSDELSCDNIYDTLSIIEKRASHVEKI
ncbi:peptidase S16, partial [Enterococcus faecalis]|nr:peptidase S16 [Enterococcus faecalis]